MKELAIGETGIVRGKVVKCVEFDGCDKCVFGNLGDPGCDPYCECFSAVRTDKKSVMFIPADSCTWTEDADGIWHTSCGQAHEFTTGTPEENQHQYCPYCGKVLEAKEYDG